VRAEVLGEGCAVVLPDRLVELRCRQHAVIGPPERRSERGCRSGSLVVAARPRPARIGDPRRSRSPSGSRCSSAVHDCREARSGTVTTSRLRVTVAGAAASVADAVSAVLTLTSINCFRQRRGRPVLIAPVGVTGATLDQHAFGRSERPDAIAADDSVRARPELPDRRSASSLRASRPRLSSHAEAAARSWRERLMGHQPSTDVAAPFTAAAVRARVHFE